MIEILCPSQLPAPSFFSFLSRTEKAGIFNDCYPWSQRYHPETSNIVKTDRQIQLKQRIIGRIRKMSVFLAIINMISFVIIMNIRNGSLSLGSGRYQRNIPMSKLIFNCKSRVAIFHWKIGFYFSMQGTVSPFKFSFCAPINSQWGGFLKSTNLNRQLCKFHLQ